MALSFANLQTGHKYLLRNYGEDVKFVILEILGNNECSVKHLETLEIFMLSDLIKYGKGPDYEINEID